MDINGKSKEKQCTQQDFYEICTGHAFSTVTYIDYVSTAIYLMHFLHGGRGVAFGQKATMDNTLDCAFKALFREDVTIVKQDGTQVSMREVLEKLGF